MERPEEVYGNEMVTTPTIPSRKIQTQEQKYRKQIIDPKFKTKAGGFVQDNEDQQSAARFKRAGMKVVKSSYRQTENDHNSQISFID